NGDSLINFRGINIAEMPVPAIIASLPPARVCAIGAGKPGHTYTKIELLNQHFALAAFSAVVILTGSGDNHFMYGKALIKICESRKLREADLQLLGGFRFIAEGRKLVIPGVFKWGSDEVTKTFQASHKSIECIYQFLLLFLSLRLFFQ